MSTGENEQALRKIIDMIRLMSMVVLFLHFYNYCYGAFREWGIVSELSDKILSNIHKTGLFGAFHYSKLIALGLLATSLLGVRGKKDEKLGHKTAFAYIISGLLVYFISYFSLKAHWGIQPAAIIYIAITSTGFILFLTGGTLLSRIIRDRLKDDIFNDENETFPQEERLLENEYSINLPAQYQLKRKKRRSWINIINPFRGCLLLGTPGAGKSYFFVRHAITQHIAKGFAMFIFDFKFPDLSLIAYNAFLKNRDKYAANTEFYVINFDDLTRTNRCNALDPSAMNDITDASESARTILLGLNKQWIVKEGDFFVDSAINFVTAIFWYLKKYRDGEYLTLPHAIEFLGLEYDQLFSLLRLEPEIENLINPFLNAYLNKAVDQLEGQIASAKIALGRLSSPQLYYVLSGNDFKLDINNPDAPKLVCMGSNPQKNQVYGPVLSLYVNRLIKLVNQKNKLKCAIDIDELAMIYLNGLDKLLATARSNRVATILALQDLSQLRKDYGKEQADAIIGIVGNIISGQVSGETAKLLSDKIGRIMQDRQSLSINRMDTSISRSKQLDLAVPTSTISSLSSGEFVGLVADNPDQKIERKAFHCEILNDHEALKREEEAYKPIPVIRKVTTLMVQRNYRQIKDDVQQIVNSELQRMMNDPELEGLIVKKK